MKKLFLLLFMWAAGGCLLSQDLSREKEAADFLPIAVWAQNPKNAAAYREIGVNMYINIHGGLDKRKLELLKAADMKVITYQNKFGLSVLDEPSIYGWMHGDEPDNAQRNNGKKWDPCKDPADIIRGYRKLKKNDPTRPVYLNVGRGVAYTEWVGRGSCQGRTDMYKISNNGYLKGCDIASFDIYPVNAKEEDVQGKLWYIAKGIDSLQAWSDHSKPTWCWIETTRISEKSKRKPTSEEVKAEVWMALIHGAKGFGYFCHSFVGKTEDDALLHDAEMLQAVKAINTEVTSLARILNKADQQKYAVVKSRNESVPVRFLAKKDGKVHYIFAVAMEDGSTRATFDVRSGKTVEVIGENRTLEIRKGKFSDNFSGYGVHLYRITK